MRSPGRSRVPGSLPPKRVSSCARTPLRARSRAALDGLFPDALTSARLALPLRLVEEGGFATHGGLARLRFSHDGSARIGIIAHCNHSIDTLPHRLDMRDQDDLLKPVLQSAQQLHNIEPARLVQ